MREGPEVDARGGSDGGSVRSCCVSVLYSRRRSPYEAGRSCVVACHTLGAVRKVLSLRLVCQCQNTMS